MNHYATNMFVDKAGRHYWFAKELKEHGYDVTVFCATTFLNRDDVIDTNGKNLQKIRRKEFHSFLSAQYRHRETE